MKKFLLQLFILIIFLSGYSLRAQDIPLYSQKLTNSLIFNPSVAGNELGSLTFSHRRFWSGIDESPTSNLISLHTPFAYHRFGIGGIIFTEQDGIYDRVTAAGAFAYHLNFTDFTTLSMGVSAEYNNLRVSTNRLDVIDESDALLFGDDFNTNSIDFSYGMSLKTKYFTLGAAANRIRTGLGLAEESNQLTPFYSGFINFILPLAQGRDVIEPIFTYRQLSTTSNQYDVGLYYTYNNIITVGGGYRSSLIENTAPQYNATAAFRIMNRMVVGYTYEAFSNRFNSNVGSSSEITLRFDFRDQTFNKNPKNAVQIMNRSLAFRRKGMSKSAPLFSKKKNRSKRLRKRLKKNYLKSPNYRMNSSKKLFSKKRKKKNKKRYKRRRRN